MKYEILPPEYSESEQNLIFIIEDLNRSADKNIHSTF